MKKIKLLLTGCILILCFALGGCMRMESSFVVNEDDSVTVGMCFAFNKAEADVKMEEMAAEMGDMNPQDILSEFTIEKYNDVEYYVYEDAQAYTQKELSDMYPTYIINKDKFYVYSTPDAIMDESGAGGSTGADSETQEIEQLLGELGLTLEDIEYIGLSVKLPSKVEKTNGEIQEDGQTVIWDYTEKIQENLTELELFAYTSADGDPAADKQTVLAQLKAWQDSMVKPTIQPTKRPPCGNTQQTVLPTPTPNNRVKADKTAPVIKGIKKNKAYKKKVTVFVKDNQKLKKVTVNGKKAKIKKVKKGKYKGYYKLIVKGKGKKTIIAYDQAGNKKKIKIRIK